MRTRFETVIEVLVQREHGFGQAVLVSQSICQCHLLEHIPIQLDLVDHSNPVIADKMTIPELTREITSSNKCAWPTVMPIIPP
jgi:hypothetical protein